ncbi:MFS transporter [Dactylosporangium aurantiacum]|uniref:MFS transporter n=1 Tax=Dactylosporangium aurantiacum TaxID=35754 RepID=A0A9Q9MCT3_9ACTN|nr:MFS transporter [Dactylosporangium aurantiacum]MDG6107552.1 MFS transporter [Dactylosporangium aurantiacum]UWZ54338.1 MFS transporter [Dactylosporangium aurantiacum]
MTVFGSLKVRNYRLFTTGQLVKLLGTWMMVVAQDWLVLQLSDNSPTALGIVTALQFTPVLLLTLYGGQLADRFDKRRLLLIANTGSALVAGLLGGLVVAGVVTLWWVFVTAALFGVISAIETPVRQAFVSELVGPELLPNALSLSSATFNTARIVGPAIAGLVIALLHDRTGPIFLITAGLCLAPLVGLSRMRTAELFRVERPPVAASDARTVDGLRYVQRRPDLSLAILLVLVVGLFGFNFQLTLAVLAKVEFNAEASYFGLLTTALAVGALAGALASSRRRSRPSAYAVLAAAVLFGGFETLVGFAPTFATAVALLLPTGFFMIYFAQAANQRVQLGTDPEFRGRVMALYVLVFLGSTPLGSLIIGWCAERFGPRSGIWVGGLVSVVATLIMAAMQLHKVGGKVRVHLRPSPHLHVFEPARKDAPAFELRVPAVR